MASDAAADADEALASLVRVVDALEAGAASYLPLQEVTEALAAQGADAAALVRRAVADDLLLVDQRARLDPSTGAPSPLAVCRLNRHHPLVRSTSSADG